MQREVLTNYREKIEVRPVTSRRDLRLFMTLPRRIYNGMEGFVAPFDMEQHGLLDPGKAAIFRHAEIQYFLAWRSGRPVGRIAAIIDQRAIEYWGEKIGQFGAFDCLPDAAIALPLLKTAEEWLVDRGVVCIRGPVTLSGNGETGCMIAGQDTPPMVAMPWHPVGLSTLIEDYGYEKTEDLLSYSLELTPDIEERFKVPAGLKFGEGRLKSITARALSKKEIVAQSEILRRLYNDAWAKKYNFVPMQDYEMRAMVKEIKPLLRTEHYVQIDQDGEPVAMAMVIPNIYDITADLGGAPSLLGWLKFAYRLAGHRFTSARVILLGVSSKLRGTILGSLLPSLAIRELMQRGKTLPYKWVELGWIQESDTGMRSLAESLVPKPHKCHRLYEKRPKK